VGAAQGDAPDPAAAEVLLDLPGQADLDPAGDLRLDFEGVVNLRQVPLLELHVERGPDDLDDLAGLLRGGGNHGHSLVGWAESSRPTLLATKSHRPWNQEAQVVRTVHQLEPGRLVLRHPPEQRG